MLSFFRSLVLRCEIVLHEMLANSRFGPDDHLGSGWLVLGISPLHSNLPVADR